MSFRWVSELPARDEQKQALAVRVGRIVLSIRTFENHEIIDAVVVEIAAFDPFDSLRIDLSDRQCKRRFAAGDQRVAERAGDIADEGHEGIERHLASPLAEQSFA